MPAPLDAQRRRRPRYPRAEAAPRASGRAKVSTPTCWPAATIGRCTIASIARLRKETLSSSLQVMRPTIPHRRPYQPWTAVRSATLIGCCSASGGGAMLYASSGAALSLPCRRRCVRAPVRTQAVDEGKVRKIPAHVGHEGLRRASEIERFDERTASRASIARRCAARTGRRCRERCRTTRSAYRRRRTRGWPHGDPACVAGGCAIRNSSRNAVCVASACIHAPVTRWHRRGR